MSKISDFLGKLTTLISIYYIKFVYRTSKIVSTGQYKLLKSDNDEKFIIVFWHGDSYSLYPYLRGQGLYVITTNNGRGDYINLICNHFGYKTIRVPDESEGGNFLFKIRREINGPSCANLTITLDGPLGPYHQPKRFPFITAALTKRRILPLTIKCKRKIQLKGRWDKFVIPLPFNRIELHVYEPLKITKIELDNEAISIRNQVLEIMK
ncbi:lysophospholipid acyltransferase family protein [Clostridium sp.]